MWQLFTEKARKVIFDAHEAARQRGHKSVSTEHLLLGLIREPDTLACRVLRIMGIELEAITAKVEALTKPGDFAPEKDMVLTPRGKRAIDLAYDEARQLGNNYIGTEHLLLGLIRERDGIAGSVLSELGADLKQARQRVVALQTEDHTKEGKAARKPTVRQELSPWSRAARHNLIIALFLEMRRGCHTDVVTAGAAAAEGSAGEELLISFGLQPAYVRLPLELQTQNRELPQSLGIDDLLASASRLVAEGKSLNSAHLLAAVALQGCPPLDTVLGDAAQRLKEKAGEKF